MAYTLDDIAETGDYKDGLPSSRTYDIIDLGKEYNVSMVFTMGADMFKQYQETGKGKGRRFFDHATTA